MIATRLGGVVTVHLRSIVDARHKAERLVRHDEALGSAVKIAGGFIFPIVQTGTVERKDNGTTQVQGQG